MEPTSLRGRLAEQVPGAAATAAALIVWTLLVRHLDSLEAPWNVLLGVGELIITVLTVHFLLAWLRPFPRFVIMLQRLPDASGTRGDLLVGHDVRLTPNAKGSVWILGRVHYVQEGWIASLVARRLWRGNFQLGLRFRPAKRPTLVVDRYAGLKWEALSSGTGAELRSEFVTAQTATCEIGSFRCEVMVDRSLGPVRLQCEVDLIGVRRAVRWTSRVMCGLRSIIVED